MKNKNKKLGSIDHSHIIFT